MIPSSAENRPSKRFGKGNPEWKSQSTCRCEGRSDARRNDLSTYRHFNPSRHARLMRRNWREARQWRLDSRRWGRKNVRLRTHSNVSKSKATFGFSTIEKLKEVGVSFQGCVENYFDQRRITTCESFCCHAQNGRVAKTRQSTKIFSRAQEVHEESYRHRRQKGLSQVEPA